MNNFRIANELNELKVLLEINGDFKSALQFENAYLTILALDYPIGNYGSLNFFPESVKDEIDNIIIRGYSPKKELLEYRTPKTLRNLAKIPSLRVSDVLNIYRFLNIDSVSDLERMLKDGLVKRKFGEKFEEHLRRALFYFEGKQKELSLFFACAYANAIKMETQHLGKIEVVGSVRRGKEVVDNIDFIFSFDKHALINFLIPSFNLTLVSIKGNLITFKDENSFKLKFYYLPERYFYSGLQYYTGSKQHNRFIQEVASTKGYGIAKSGMVLLEANSEKEFYEKLTLAYIPPEVREGEEEIDFALNNSSPNIVDISDIKGDLHVHSNFSDGSSTIAEIKEEARYLNYEFIAITDHSKSLRIANGLDEALLRREFEVIDRLNSFGDPPFLLKGIEAEIKENGSVDIEEDFFDKFDFVVGGLHKFSNSSFENTYRIKKALNSGLVDTLAHPTNRIVFIRRSIPINLEEIFEVAFKKSVALEINLFPNRMDLSSGLIKQAKRSHVKYFSVGTDAHSVGHLNFMKYGIKILKRAWVKKEEVLNTFCYNDIRNVKWIKTHLE